MTQTDVDFHLVRYSAIEGTHYFHDPAYPASIQFLVNGKWEPWDVGYVRRKAQDPVVAGVAQEAEEKLLRDQTSGYIPWPQSLDPTANGDGPSLPSLTDPPLSPASLSPTSPRSAGPGSSSLSWPSQRYTSPYSALPSPYTSQAPEQPGTHRRAGSLNAGNSTGLQAAYIQSAASPVDTPSSPLPPTPNRDTKILLSLDGDGIRGLSTVLLVESLVNAICSKLGRRVDPHQIFDLIGGVSTNGLLAIMIGRLRMRVHRAREAYTDIAKAMYMDKFNFYVSHNPHVPRPQYNGAMLEDSIKNLVVKESGSLDEAFYDQRPDSTNVFVIATKIDIGFNQPAIIRSYPTRRMAGPEVDAGITTWQAIHGTLGAPRYMDRVPGQDRRFVIEPGLVDYGTAKNNPIRDLYFECRKLYSYANDTMVVVSMGTGIGFDRAKELKELANSVEDRTTEARLMEDKFMADHANLMEQGWMKYFRFNVPGLEDVALDESTELERIKEKTSAYLAQPDVGARFYACVDTIIGVMKGDVANWPQFG